MVVRDKCAGQRAGDQLSARHDGVLLPQAEESVSKTITQQPCTTTDPFLPLMPMASS